MGKKYDMSSDLCSVRLWNSSYFYFCFNSVLMLQRNWSHLTLFCAASYSQYFIVYSNADWCSFTESARKEVGNLRGWWAVVSHRAQTSSKKSRCSSDLAVVTSSPSIVSAECRRPWGRLSFVLCSKNFHAAQTWTPWWKKCERYVLTSWSLFRNASLTP